MVPSYMMQLEKLPVTSNGKLDRKSLPNIQARSEKEYIGPRTEMEKVLAEIFEEVLHVDRVGIKDNFFELGGHSLKAMQLKTLIERKTGLIISLKELFDNSTVEELTATLVGKEKHQFKTIPKADKKEFYAMHSAQKRLYILDQMNQSTTYNMPGIIEVDGLLKKEQLERAVKELVRRHESLRTSFHMINGEPVQKVAEEVELTVEYEERAEWIEAEQKEFIRPFDLSKVPLMRIKHIKIGENKTRILFDIHHIISDGISMNLLTKEIHQILLFQRKQQGK